MGGGEFFGGVFLVEGVAVFAAEGGEVDVVAELSGEVEEGLVLVAEECGVEEGAAVGEVERAVVEEAGFVGEDDVVGGLEVVPDFGVEVEGVGGIEEAIEVLVDGDDGEGDAVAGGAGVDALAAEQDSVGGVAVPLGGEVEGFVIAGVGVVGVGDHGALEPGFHGVVAELEVHGDADHGVRGGVVEGVFAPGGLGEFPGFFAAVVEELPALVGDGIGEACAAGVPAPFFEEESKGGIARGVSGEGFVEDGGEAEAGFFGSELSHEVACEADDVALEAFLTGVFGDEGWEEREDAVGLITDVGLDGGGRGPVVGEHAGKEPAVEDELDAVGVVGGVEGGDGGVELAGGVVEGHLAGVEAIDDEGEVDGGVVGFDVGGGLGVDGGLEGGVVDLVGGDDAEGGFDFGEELPGGGAVFVGGEELLLGPGVVEGLVVLGAIGAEGFGESGQASVEDIADGLGGGGAGVGFEEWSEGGSGKGGDAVGGGVSGVGVLELLEEGGGVEGGGGLRAGGGGEEQRGGEGGGGG